MKIIFKIIMSLLIVSLGALTVQSFSINREDFSYAATAKPFLIDETGPTGEVIGTYSGKSGVDNLFQIAKDLGAKPYFEDKISIFPSDSLGIGGKITLQRAPLYTIYDGKRKKEVRSWKKTVGELLIESKVPEIGVDDKVNFALDFELENNMTVRINRVAITTVIEKEVTDYQVIKKLNASIEKGNKTVLQKGVKGSKNKFYLVTREDGVEVSRKYLRSEVVTSPIEEIVEVGTRVVVYETGKATWYGWPSMEKTNAFFAASKTLPKGTVVWVVNTANGKGVKVTILDRVSADVSIDLSPKAFAAIGSLGSGVINVRIEKYYPEV